MGSAYSSIGEYQQAIELYQESLDLSQELKERQDEAYALSNLGNAYHAQGRYQQAIDYHQRSLGIKREINDLRGQAYSLSNLGAAFGEIGLHERAVEFYEKQLELAQVLNAPQIEAIALENMGVALTNLEQYQEAFVYFQRSLSIKRRLQDRFGEAIALSNIGTLLETTDRVPAAILILKKSVNVWESIRQDISGLNQSERQSFTNTIAGTYRFLADLLIDEGRFLEALQVLELLKAEEIREYTRGTVVNIETGEIRLSPAELEVVDTLNELVQLGLKIDDCENKVQSCSRDELFTWYDNRELLTEEWKTLIAALELAESEETPTPGDLTTEGVKEVLDAQPNTVLIYPVIQADRLVLLWATRGGIANAIEVPQATEADINQAAFEFRQLMRQCEVSGCTTEDIPTIQAVAQRLHHWLIPQDLDTLLQEEGIENIVFALDKQLRYIPVAALHNGEEYLAERYTLSTVTAAWLTPTANPLPTNPADVSILALGLSDEVPDSDPADDVPYFRALPYVEDELKGIIQSTDTDAGIYPGIDLLNDTFDDRAFYGLKIDGHQILHIATHGLFVPTNLSSSFLMLGTKEDWRISEMETVGQHFTDLSLVVLSACETALGGAQQTVDDAKALDGREISGIAQTFLDAGADAIIASLWKVNDASTSGLMQQFYLELAKGTEENPVTVSQALQRSQMALLSGEVDPMVAETLNRGPVDWADESEDGGEGDRSIADLAHPFYWAPFVIIGNGL